ncbi:hypothetical protein [Streptomyces sp. NPDC048196]|uniref:hypothetical protein n=1 Tax=Streptomyces sp. NPDC048196 TaxID=3154712 RepID=UPI0034092419
MACAVGRLDLGWSTPSSAAVRTHGEPQLDGIIAECAAGGWTRRAALPAPALTDEGRAAHAEAATRIAVARAPAGA